MAKRYRTIVADPPWPYTSPGEMGKDGQSKGAGSVRLYGSMGLADLAGLITPHAGPAIDDDAHLYLWTTNAFLAQAHDLAKAWGFAPKTVLTWTKVKPDGAVSMKMGYYFRGATEHIVFAVRGALPLQTSEALPTGYLWPRLPHSAKPDVFYDLVEKASPGPYLELFARRARFGWDYWGNESLGTAEEGCMNAGGHGAFREEWR